MSSQKGNVSRSRGQRHQNTFGFKNDKYGATAQVKKAKSKTHDGLCQRCKDVIEWKVKYNKYKSLTQARKCVKCSQKTVKDAYHIICKPCSLQLEICCKCGKKEDIIIPIYGQFCYNTAHMWTVRNITPINSQVDKEEEEEEAEDGIQQNKGDRKGKKDMNHLDNNDEYDDEDLRDLGDDDEEEDDDDEGEDFNHCVSKKTKKKSDVIPDVSRVNIKD